MYIYKSMKEHWHNQDKHYQDVLYISVSYSTEWEKGSQTVSFYKVSITNMMQGHRDRLWGIGKCNICMDYPYVEMTHTYSVYEITTPTISVNLQTGQLDINICMNTTVMKAWFIVARIDRNRGNERRENRD